MTTANKITVVRIVMIPAFVTMAIYYGESIQRGQPLEWQRFAAIAIFILAAVSDGLDGYVARRYNQRSTLGVILDPIADKGLLLSGIITLSLTSWSEFEPASGKFPAWFPVLVISRDAILLVGTLVLYLLNGKVQIKPHWTGKIGDAAIPHYSIVLRCACSRRVHTDFRDHLRCRRRPSVAGRRPRASGETLGVGCFGD
ncbi:MAG: CDP-alcohol phosphatidyltransferase family protein [Verrucomicrobia bacterium]|nr:MAG: CDP-alcohol phosphatidyltransferase family protein [Verrucomicrobiota bacterium]